MNVFLLVLQSLWFIWPAYVANAAPTIMRGTKPLDFGKKIGRNRILGDSKTLEGTVGGIMFGLAMGVIQTYIQPFLPGFFLFTPEILFLMCVGTLFGDVAGSFIKRRLGIKPGGRAFLLDQLGFLVAALAFASAVYVPDVYTIVTLLVITPVFHLGTNRIGYALGLKNHPW